MATTLNCSYTSGRGCVQQFLYALHGFLLAVVLAGCQSVPISYYDATTYTNLTNLKAETTVLIESFDKKTFTQNESKIEGATLNLRKAYEYEKGKGDPNSDTAQQFEIVAKLYADTINEYKDNGPEKLGPKYFQEAARALGQAFDIAIATENVKNKDKR
jgi:hypothetical protein